MSTDRRTGRAHRLAQEAREAAAVRALAARPEVVALRVERVGAQVDVLLWTGIGLGLLFTMVNVQRFAAGGAPAFTAVWWAAWLLDPMVSLVLLAVIRAEQVTARYQLRRSSWARLTKWCAFAATYVMNTWESWGLHGAAPSAAGVVLHSIPPLLVLLAAEAGPALREQLARAAAASVPTEHTASVREPAGVHETSADGVRERPGPAGWEARDPGATITRRRPDGTARPVGRRMFGDYLTEARAALAAAGAAGNSAKVTPSWCRAVTGCSAGTSVKLAAALRDAEMAGASS